MLLNIAADIAKLSLFIVCAYALLGAYARLRRPQWADHLTKRRLAVLGMLTLAVGGIKLIEDVVAKESGPVDEAILWFIRNHIPAVLNGFFAAVTFSGSARFWCRARAWLPYHCCRAPFRGCARRRIGGTATLIVRGEGHRRPRYGTAL